MKTSVVIFLIFCLTAPFTGTYIFLGYKKNKIKSEVNELILKEKAKKDLVVLKFTHEESKTRLTWKHAREFEYNGQMYDIVDQKTEGDFIAYTCYKDHKETRLNREKEKLIAKALGQDPVQKKQTERLKNFLKSVFQHEISAWKPFISQSCNIHYAPNIKHYSLFLESPPSPPPKCT